MKEDTFLHLCVHGGKHGWTSLNWLVDLCSQIIRSPDIAERSMRLVNPQSEVAAMVRFGLAAAAVVAPEIVQSAGGFNSFAERVVRGGLSGVLQDETPISRFRFQASLGLNRLAIFRFALRRLFIPNQDDWDTLPVQHREAALSPGAMASASAHVEAGFGRRKEAFSPSVLTAPLQYYALFGLSHYILRMCLT